MELPQPPQDNDLRNIIDKLAQFVARNGPEFEQMTKSKQKNNPKFSFLYGGEYFNYYQYKVTTEQAILKQHGGRQDNSSFFNQSSYGGDIWNPAEGNSATSVQPPPQLVQPVGIICNNVNSSSLPSLNVSNSGNSALNVIALSAQQATLHKQIKQSQANLNAQHAALIQQQQTQIEEIIMNAQNEMIQRLATECNISLSDFDNILQPIIESCTKDSISAGKGWILNHATSHEAGTVISKYLLKKITTPGSTFTQKLHIIYLVNDVLHHCARKNADNLMKNLESVVIPMFCKTSIAITEEQEAKLNKLLKLWESKTNYFDPSIIQKMKNPTTSYQEYQTNLIAQYANLITPLTQQTKSTFENYQQQHQIFVAHSLQQIQQLELQKQLLTSQITTNNQQAEETNNVLQPSVQNQIPAKPSSYGQKSFMELNFNQQGQPIIANNTAEQSVHFNSNNNKPLFPINENDSNYGSSNGSQEDDKKSFNYEDYNSNENSSEGLTPLPPINLSQPPPGFFNDGVPRFENGLPDLSKPPPGFNNVPEVSQEDLMPIVPYFELPAGLIVPLIMLEDCDYKPLDPEAIRLPPPAPPSERLLAAVKAFYAKPNHTRPQDSEGWEKLGLYEYYKAKNAVRKQKEEDIKNGIRQRSRSPTPIKYDYQILKSPPARRYRSKSRSPTPKRSRSRSPAIIRSSPERGRARGNRSLRRSPSPSSPPPSFMTPSMGNLTDTSELDSSNKGHQMLKKMGWGQGGLGAAGQGIAAPINAGMVRDRQDQYKGVGVNLNDPYENFRKNKGAAFITRMKERALERS